MAHILDSEHVFISGQTGTGKSILAESYLAGFDRVLKLDTKGEYYERLEKGEPIWRGLVEHYDFTVVTRFNEIEHAFEETDKVIYTPHFEELSMDAYEETMSWVYYTKHTALWIDELMEVAPSPFQYPKHMKALYTRGRSRHTPVWALTQRPMDIPAICLSQATHMFIFNLRQPQDRKKVADATGAPEFLVNPSKQGERNFWYFRDGWESPIKASIVLKTA